MILLILAVASSAHAQPVGLTLEDFVSEVVAANPALGAAQQRQDTSVTEIKRQISELEGLLARELARGELEQVMVKGDAGYILMSYAGRDAVLTVIARKEAKLGLIFLDAKRAARSVAEIL